MARKWLLLCSSLLLIMLMLPVAAFAAETPAVSILVSNDQPALEENIQVTVKAEQVTDLYAFELSLYYDPAQLEFQEGSEKTELKGFAVPVKQSEAGGHHLIFAHTKTGTTASVNGSAELVTFTFAAKKAANAVITLKDVKLLDSGLHQIAAAAVSANITIAGGGGGGGSVPSPSPSPSTDTDVVDVISSQLANATGSTVVVQLPESATKVRLPYNAFELLGSKQLEVNAGEMKLLVPSSLFKQLEGKVPAEQLKDSAIILKIETLVKSQADALLALIASESKAGVKAGGDIYEFNLYLQTKDGGMHELKDFNEAMTIHIAAGSGIDSKLSNIYYVAENGKLEFVGGEHTGGQMKAQISHFSKYALLEINKSFADVKADFWAASVIKELAAKQIVTGTGDITFEPLRSVTRAEFTSLLVRALKLTETGTSTFADVKGTEWYAADINMAVKAGLIQGRSAAVFAPNEKITREELAVLVLRAFELQSGTTASGGVAGTFKDAAQISVWAGADVSKAVELGLLQGRTKDQFVPKGISNRAEAAQVIYNLLFKV
ncbi:S-layer homology domain-containing protein [Paenibacillus paridis]|uniref:S-layer homology domain-containing protein n=1 Tax=Paenibacillus paridis TaxID=2583376 RepID=UPI00111DC19D|nr:S-layer homology domain-containing protein [Paenibacillus paridis]